VISPRISILMPFHNEAAFIAEAAGSVLAQTEVDFELIAVDDGSTDDSAHIVAAFNDRRIRLIRPGKIGKNAALNLAFLESRAPVITFFCADDTLPADSLRHKLDALSTSHPLEDAVMVYGKARLMSTDKRFDGLVVPRDPSRGSDSASAQAFTRALANRIFPLPESLPNEDQWSALTARFFADRIIHIPVIVWNYRIHAENSHNRYFEFKRYSEQYHRRFLVFSLFLNMHHERLDAQAVAFLNRNAELEEARFSGRIWGILAVEVPFKERIRALIYAIPLLFGIRMRFYGFLSGR
jgi:glycosyltransferase involved in cell wall biosynthesis